MPCGRRRSGARHYRLTPRGRLAGDTARRARTNRTRHGTGPPARCSLFTWMLRHAVRFARNGPHWTREEWRSRRLVTRDARSDSPPLPATAPGRGSRALLPGTAPDAVPRHPPQALLSGAVPERRTGRPVGRSALLRIPTTMPAINRTPASYVYVQSACWSIRLQARAGQSDIRPMSYIAVLRNSSGPESRYRQRSDQPICRAIC